ncbi:MULTISPECIES: NAD-dependent epimerase/dehydratase family protein [unclassified Moorena]|uniref:NAD-dependent epimerase/dehydratase family protein n=1 Tax=unclassified Moorena TaxID=2683338 RepID=UPI0013FFCA9E|nr:MULTISPECIES: NAD-dependent epimerase/dehydratase family protein [unclassified Moorena]NEO15300.1 NAD-dependent epimerase/dehydratase family protein [Moorena sp. SIO3E8]NEQ01702.1 NAD-dependent epimerase/dehydratase family protein [Moorena sp. SIO3F7]
MKLFITGICGFVGSTLTKALLDHKADLAITGIDNLSRSGSWLNREILTKQGVKVVHGDIRNASDLEALGPFDWVIDCAANPSVLAGVDGQSSSRQLIEHNLGGTINLLEACKRWNAGFILLSTSRVYSIPPLAQLKVEVHDRAFRPCLADSSSWPVGLSEQGISEAFSTAPPISLYGSTKLASETLALEYGLTFGFPVWINRCGVLAGAGQFGHPGQGIFAFWIHSFREKRSLKYIGFGGNGYQVRDCLHPNDLIPLLEKQFAEPLSTDKPRIINVSGGVANSMSLKLLSQWCEDRFGYNEVIKTNTERPFDIPWMVLNSQKAASVWDWTPQTKIYDVLSGIADFAEGQENWCRLSAS